MPRKKSYKKSRRYRRYRRKRYATPSNVLGPLRTKQRAKHIYHEEFSLDPGAVGSPASYVFSCNGLYDPNITGVGHQPRGFDQLTQLYDHYVVIGAKMTVHAINTDTGNGNMIIAMIRDGTTVLSSPNDILEARFIKSKVMSPEGSGKNQAQMTIKVNPNKFLGKSKPLSSSELKGSSSSNPSEQCFFHLYGIPQPSQIDTAAIWVRVRIEYETVWIEPKQPSES